MTLPVLPTPTTEFSLPQELLLLAIKESGAIRNDSSIGFGLTGAALVELVRHERVSIADKHVVLLDATPIGEPAADVLLGRIASEPKQRKASRWVAQLRRDLLVPTASALRRAEQVSDASSRWLGVTWQHRYPLLDHTVEQALRARLRLVVAGGAPGDDRTHVLALLLDATGLAGAAIPDLPLLRRRARMNELLAQTWGSEAVKAAVVAVRQAIQSHQAAGAAAA